jgi:hypothetical protein
VLSQFANGSVVAGADRWSAGIAYGLTVRDALALLRPRRRRASYSRTVLTARSYARPVRAATDREARFTSLPVSHVRCRAHVERTNQLLPTTTSCGRTRA